MLEWYLTPASISYLAQFILALAITSHSLRLTILSARRRAETLSHIAPLTGFFAGFTLYLLLLFLETALLPGDRLIATYLQIIPLSLGMVCLIQFTYQFPSSTPGQKWERRIILTLTSLYALWETGYALYRLRLLWTEGLVRFRSDTTDIFLALIFLWVPLMLLRQSVRTSIETQTHTTLWFRHVWSPQGQAAQSTRALALVYLVPFALSVLWLANTFRFAPIGSTNIVFSLGILSALFTFTVVYLNYLPETTTFMVKVSGMALVSLLAVWSVTGWVIGPQFIDQYPEDRIPQQRTLRFTPNAVGGYDVAVVPFHFDPVGEKWGNFTEENWTDILPLPFAFRFYEQTWREAYVSVIGGISFGQERIYQDLEYRYGSVPGILPLHPAQSTWPLEEGQVYLNANADRVMITWRQSAEGFSTVGTYTFQLSLYPNGVFEVTHNEITDVKSRVFWTIGVIAGDPARAPRQVNLIDGLPLSGGAEGMVHDSYRAFRSYLHQVLSPLAWLVFGSASLFIVGLPLFLHFNLVKPLNDLLEGVKQVNSGNLQVSIPVHFPDEIGFLTRSVNDMAASINLQVAERRRAEGDLRELTATLEQRIADRTRELSALYDISALATSTHDIELLLHESLKRTLAAMHCEMGAILLVNETKDIEPVTRLRVAAHQGLPPELTIAPIMTAAADGLFAMLRDRRQPVFIPDLSIDSRVPTAMRALGSQAFLIAPLQAEKDVLGIVGVLRDIVPAFTPEEIALLSTISDQLGAAVHSYHLRQALQSAALLEERQRLSRDLHDSVTQSLYGLVALSEAGQARLETAAPQKVEEILARIGKTARQALQEMRLFIYQMRPPDLEQLGLAMALQLRLAAVEGHSGVQARLLTDDDLHLPRHIEDAFYQIAQEALNNTLRHANAKTVTVHLHRASHQLELEVVDDGQGFDPAQADRGGLGLANMHERVRAIGGTLTISSAPGLGTQIKVRLERERGRNGYSEDSRSGG